MTGRSKVILVAAVAVALSAAVGVAALGVAGGTLGGDADGESSSSVDDAATDAVDIGSNPVLAAGDDSDGVDDRETGESPTWHMTREDGAVNYLEADRDADAPRPVRVTEEYSLDPETSIEDAASTPDGGAVLVGSNVDPTHGDVDGRIVKLDAAGEVEWIETLGGPDSDSFAAVHADEDGIVAAGSTASFADHGEDGWIVHLSADGDVHWKQTTAAKADESYCDVDAAVPGADGAYALLGSTTVDDDSTDWLQVVDEHGEQVWRTAFESDSGDEHVRSAEALATTTAGYGVYGSDTGDSLSRLVHFDESGDEVWNETYGTVDSPIRLAFGDLIATDDALVWTATHGGSGVWRAKVDLNGTEVWFRMANQPHRLDPDLVAGHDAGFLEASIPYSVYGVDEDGVDRWELTTATLTENPAVAQLSTDEYVLAHGSTVQVLSPFATDAQRVDLTAYDSLESFAADWGVREHPDADTWNLVYLGAEEPTPFATIDTGSWPPECGSPACAEATVIGNWTVEHHAGTVELEDGAWLGASVTVDEHADEVTVRIVGDGVDESMTVERAAMESATADADEVLEPGTGAD